MLLDQIEIVNKKDGVTPSIPAFGAKARRRLTQVYPPPI